MTTTPRRDAAMRAIEEMRARAARRLDAARRGETIPTFEEQVRALAGGIASSMVDGCTLAEAHALLPVEVIEQIITDAAMPGATDADYGGKALVYRRVELEAAFHQAVIHALIAGELAALGYDDRAGINAAPVEIPADRWRTLTSDAKSSAAAHSTGKISGLRIFRAIAKPRDRRTPGAVSESVLRKTYKAYVAERVAAGLRSGEKADLAEMQRRLGTGVTRPALRRVRKACAPEEWKRAGRHDGD
jgi:hypothetical protein